MTTLSEQQLQDILAMLKEKLSLRVETQRKEGYLEVRVALYLDEELITESDDSARVDY